MKISQFNYDLSDELIAQNPPLKRGDSKLLVLNKENGKLIDAKYGDLFKYLNPGDLLVLNNSKVIKARLIATNQMGHKRELVVLERHGQSGSWHKHKVLCRGKVRTNDCLTIDGHNLIIDKVIGDGLAIIKSATSLLEICEQYGQVPLPPYMHREATNADEERYQTIWAKQSGSVAAPTASLNMTNQLLNKLQTKGIKVAYITLHVGLGTFLPIRADDVENHVMHQEYYKISVQTVTAIKTARQDGHRVIALGTTVARTLEYSADDLSKVDNKQLSGEADIFIYPGYQFKIVDALITNYHAPRSTVLMLAAAFAGWDNLKNAYEHAKVNKYKLLSYGDSMLIQ